MSNVGAGVVIGGTPTARTITANSTNYAYNVTTASSTATIAGPVKTIVITATTIGANAEFFLSDISACVTNPGFTNNYYTTYTQPYTGQPAYFLATPDNSLGVYMLDPSTATADLVFTDPGTALGSIPAGTALNSLAYDPVNHWIYYVMNASGNGPGNRGLKKYDVTTGTISAVISDINTLGIPTFIQGIEAASAAFYDGSLYLGIEGTDASSFSTNTESIIWRIDFDGSGTPIRASQVFGVPSDNGAGQPSHDWGDFITRNGTIVTHASNYITPYQSMFHHFNMQTSQITNTYTSYIDTAGQLGQIWNGTVYRVDNRVALYNENGTTGAATTVTVTSCSPSWNNRPANDASCPFRPAQDFGDAPATYDTDALAPAAHQRACNNSILYLGSTWDREWSKNTSADASGDGADEDAIATVTTMVSDGNSYNHVQDVTVFNNTGADATLGGWLDYDADGVFEASEGVTVTVPSSSSPQTITLAWTGITVAIGTPDSYLRIRLISGTGTMTTGSATGWFSDGEVEDYPVISSQDPLIIELLDFDATLTRDNNVLLKWTAYADNDASGFEVEQSTDQQTWKNIGWVDINKTTYHASYSLLDRQPTEGRSYYRLKMVEKSGSSRYSSIRMIQIDKLERDIKIYPNPARNYATLNFNADRTENAVIRIRSLSGQTVSQQKLTVNQGINNFQLQTTGLPDGVYILELTTSLKTYINKISVIR
jgi:hypothetical protein